ncbi:MAG TPA: flagellar hook-associated protein FlgK [Firmicutes bacterium]|nr:flagellar hook-associated protein FlgK [Bacillota bacterium]
MSGFAGLETARRGLAAQRYSMEITGQNISNAYIPGYTRQVAVHGTAPQWWKIPLGSTAGAFYTGVEIVEVKRSYDAYLWERARDLQSKMTDGYARYDILSRLEEVLNEPSDAGLGTALEDFWSSWSQLAVAPNSNPSRIDVIYRAVTVAENFRLARQRVAELQVEAEQHVEDYLKQLNELVTGLADINRTISASKGAGHSTAANHLLDRRDQLLEEIASIAKVAVSVKDDGTVRVSLAGLTLVDGDSAFQVGMQKDAATGRLELVWGDKKLSAEQIGGYLGGYLSAHNDDLNFFAERLDALAVSLIEQVNALHMAGYDKTGRPGEAFFTGTGAADINISAAIMDNPEKLAAAAGTDASDGDQAQKIANLRSEPAFAGGKCVSVFYREIITELGLKSRSAFFTYQSDQVLSDYIERRKEALAGVSLDEELTDMIMHQQAYNASARLLTAIDEMLEVLINRTGIVGR